MCFQKCSGGMCCQRLQYDLKCCVIPSDVTDSEQLKFELTSPFALGTIIWTHNAVSESCVLMDYAIPYELINPCSCHISAAIPGLTLCTLFSAQYHPLFNDMHYMSTKCSDTEDSECCAFDEF